MFNYIKNLSPKASFIIGLLVSLFIMFTVGFFIMLGITLNKSDNNSEKNNQANNQEQKNNQEKQNKVSIKKITKEDHVKGNFDAPITIVEFSDTECPFCKKFHNTMQQIVNKYSDQVRWVYKHAPLDNLHSKARKESIATECAWDQGGNESFWKYTDKLFEITPSNNKLDLEELPKIAEQIGLDVNEFNKCLDSNKFAEKVQNHLLESADAGLQGTPHSVINFDGKNIPLSGAYSFNELKQIIDSLIK